MAQDTDFRFTRFGAPGSGSGSGILEAASAARSTALRRSLSAGGGPPSFEPVNPTASAQPALLPGQSLDREGILSND